MVYLHGLQRGLFLLAFVLQVWALVLARPIKIFFEILVPLFVSLRVHTLESLLPFWGQFIVLLDWKTFFGIRKPRLVQDAIRQTDCVFGVSHRCKDSKIVLALLLIEETPVKGMWSHFCWREFRYEPLVPFWHAASSKNTKTMRTFPIPSFAALRLRSLKVDCI